MNLIRAEGLLGSGGDREQQEEHHSLQLSDFYCCPRRKKVFIWDFLRGIFIERRPCASSHSSKFPKTCALAGSPLYVIRKQEVGKAESVHGRRGTLECNPKNQHPRDEATTARCSRNRGHSIASAVRISTFSQKSIHLCLGGLRMLDLAWEVEEALWHVGWELCNLRSSILSYQFPKGETFCRRSSREKEMRLVAPVAAPVVTYKYWVISFLLDLGLV